MQIKLFNILIIILFFLGLMSCSEKKETKQEQNEQITVAKQESRAATLKSETVNEDEEENNEADDEEKEEDNDEEDEIEDKQDSLEENEGEEEGSSSTEEGKEEMKKGDLIILGTIDVFGNLIAEDGKIYNIAENEHKEKLIHMVDRKVEIKGSTTEEEGYPLIIVSEFREIE